MFRPLANIMRWEVQHILRLKVDRYKADQSSDDHALSDNDQDPEGFDLCQELLRTIDEWKVGGGSNEPDRVFSQRCVYRCLPLALPGCVSCP